MFLLTILYVWHLVRKLVGTTFPKSHMTCFQSAGDAKPNGQPAYSLQSTCSWFNSKTFWEWIHRCLCVCLTLVVWFSLGECVSNDTNEYVCTMPASSAHRASFIWAEPNCNVSVSPATGGEPDRQTGTLHLLEKPDS